MKLDAVARAFDSMRCYDAYDASFAFKGQLNLYDDNIRDSETAIRRVISTRPGVTLPPRRVVQSNGLHFILGSASPDIWNGNTLRVGYVAHEAEDLSLIRTLEQVCLGVGGIFAYAGRVWIKNLAYTEQDSHLAGETHIHFSQTETVQAGFIVTYKGTMNIVRATNNGAGGSLVCVCDQMEEPSVDTGMINNNEYDPVSDTRAGEVVEVRVIRVRWQSLFEYKNIISPKFSPGDIQLVMAASVITPKSGATITLSDGEWVINGVQLEGNVWFCKASKNNE